MSRTQSPTESCTQITLGFDSPNWFYIRTLCVYAFRLYTSKMHIISTFTKIAMTIAGAVRAARAATGNVRCPLKIIVPKMCQLHRIRIEWIKWATVLFGHRLMSNKRPHTVPASILPPISVNNQQHTKSIMRVHS